MTCTAEENPRSQCLSLFARAKLPGATPVLLRKAVLNALADS
ncbi:hypothetical protein AGR7B_Lc160010 [Agrobacterium deltaense RV3]|nr:hypothetical protein AGR7B_Lc160010 [Agrobacterium deltaense RV3]